MAATALAAACGSTASYPTRDAAPDVPIEAGTVSINGGFDLCPTVLVQIAPMNIRVGESVSVTGQVLNLDTGSPDGGGPDAGRADAAMTSAGSLTFAWTLDSGTSGSGKFANPSSSETTFTCTTAGPVTLALAVSDGKCTTTQPSSLFCQAGPDAGAGGSGGLGGAGGTGNMGGTGGPGASSGSAGTGGTGTSTGAAGATGAAGSAGMSGSAGKAGTSGKGGSGGSIVLPPVVNICPDEPNVAGPMCATCTTNNCDLSAETGDSGCCALSSVNDQMLCVNVIACVLANVNTCVDRGGNPTSCFCGTTMAECFTKAGAANGPCKAQVLAAAKTTVPASVQLLFTDTTSPLGRAVNLMTCRGSNCASECILPH